MSANLEAKKQVVADIIEKLFSAFYIERPGRGIPMAGAEQ